MRTLSSPKGLFSAGNYHLRVGNIGDSRVLLGRADGSIYPGPGTDSGLTTDRRRVHFCRWFPFLSIYVILFFCLDQLFVGFCHQSIRRTTSRTFQASVRGLSGQVEMCKKSGPWSLQALKAYRNIAHLWNFIEQQHKKTCSILPRHFSIDPKVMGVARVNGDLAVSRAFGDAQHKTTGGKRDLIEGLIETFFFFPRMRWFHVQSIWFVGFFTLISTFLSGPQPEDHPVCAAPELKESTATK